MLVLSIKQWPATSTVYCRHSSWPQSSATLSIGRSAVSRMMIWRWLDNCNVLCSPLHIESLQVSISFPSTHSFFQNAINAIGAVRSCGLQLLPFNITSLCLDCRDFFIFSSIFKKFFFINLLSLLPISVLVYVMLLISYCVLNYVIDMSPHVGFRTVTHPDTLLI